MKFVKKSMGIGEMAMVGLLVRDFVAINAEMNFLPEYQNIRIVLFAQKISEISLVEIGSIVPDSVIGSF